MKVTRKIIEIDEERCDGCGNCVPSCAEGAIQIIDGKAKVIGDKYCVGLAPVLGIARKMRLSSLSARLTNIMNRLFTHGLIIKNQQPTPQNLRGVHHSR